MAEQRAAGLKLDHDGISVSGFPNRFDLTVTGIDLADPARGLAWKAPFAQVFAMTWKPWHLIAALPNAQSIALPDQELALQSSRMMGSLLVVPGTELALEEIVVEGEDLVLQSSAGWLVGARKMVLSTRLDPTRKTAHRLGLALTELAPDPAISRAAGLPDRIAKVFLDATADLDAPLDRHAAATAPRLVHLDLRAARLVWGVLKLEASGELGKDGEGFATGQITIRVEAWQALPKLLAATGMITPDFAPVLERGLLEMAEAGEDPAVLVVDLRAEAGRLYLGPFPIGQAPFWG